MSTPIELQELLSNGQVLGREAGDLSGLTRASTSDVAAAQAAAEAHADAAVAGLGGALVFNVAGYGAVGDGVADDTAAVGDAVAAVKAAGGGTLYFPTGDYLVQPWIRTTGLGGINIDFDHAAVFVAPGATLRTAAVDETGRYSMVNVLEADDVWIGGGGTIIGDLADHYGDTSPGSQSGMCVTVASSTNVRIENLTIREAWGDGIYVASRADSYPGSERVRITNLLVQDCRREGMGIFFADDVTISDCIIEDMGVTALALGVAAGPRVGIDVEPNLGAGQMVRRLAISNTIVRNCQGRGMNITGGDGATTTDVTITGCVLDSNSQKESGDNKHGMSISDVQRATVTGCVVRNHPEFGFEARNGSEVVFSACISEGNGTGFRVNTIGWARLNGCEARGNVQRGFTVDSVLMSGCTSAGNATGGAHAEVRVGGDSFLSGCVLDSGTGDPTYLLHITAGANVERAGNTLSGEGSAGVVLDESDGAVSADVEDGVFAVRGPSNVQRATSERLWIFDSRLNPGNGAPTLGIVGSPTTNQMGGSGWVLAAGQNRGVVAWIDPVQDRLAEWQTFDVWAHWVPNDATAGNVRLFGHTPTADPLDGVVDALTNLAAVSASTPEVAWRRTRTLLNGGTPLAMPSATELWRVSVHRNGSQVADTYTAPVTVIALELVRVS